MTRGFYYEQGTSFGFPNFFIPQKNILLLDRCFNQTCYRN